MRGLICMNNTFINKTIMSKINDLSFRFSRLAAGSLCMVALATAALATESKSPSATLAPPACAGQFAPPVQYDKGVQSSIAAHRSGLVLEFHKTDHGIFTDIW